MLPDISIKQFLIITILCLVAYLTLPDLLASFVTKTMFMTFIACNVIAGTLVVFGYTKSIKSGCTVLMFGTVFFLFTFVVQLFFVSGGWQ